MRLGASLRLRLPVAGGHIPLLVAHLQVAEDAVVLRAVSLLIVLEKTKTFSSARSHLPLSNTRQTLTLQ